jgi:hypothetical protein
MPFISYCYLVWFLYYSHFKYRVCKNFEKGAGLKVLTVARMKKEYTPMMYLSLDHLVGSFENE